MSSRQFVKLENTYYEVISGNKGIELRHLSSDEVLSLVSEEALLDVKTLSNTDNIVNKAITNVRTSLSKSIEASIEKVVFNTLGFSNSWGKWEVDHCNGRMGDVSNFIAKEVKDKILSELATNYAPSEKDLIDIKLAMKKEFISKYERELRNTIQRNAAELAEQHARAYLEEVITEKLKDSKAMILEAVISLDKK